MGQEKTARNLRQSPSHTESTPKPTRNGTLCYTGEKRHTGFNYTDVYTQTCLYFIFIKVMDV